MSQAKAAPSRRRPRRRLLEWVAVIIVAVLVAGGLRAFVVQAFYVPSGSMLPTLQLGDRILVVKVGYTIHRGDIVVFRRTPADTSTADADLVKRVIGLPGETISSIGDTVLINGSPIKEPWLPPLTMRMTSQGPVECSQIAYDIPKTKIPPGHYFMMGDCRGIPPTAGLGAHCRRRTSSARSLSSCGVSVTRTFISSSVHLS